MSLYSFFQDASVQGTGASILTSANVDDFISGSIVGRTISFDGNTVNIDLDADEVIDDFGTTASIEADFTINGQNVVVGDLIEYNYNLIGVAPDGTWYRIDVFAFGDDDGNKGYAVSNGWDPDTQTYVDPPAPYAGEELTILDRDDIASGLGLPPTGQNSDPLVGTSASFQEFARYDPTDANNVGGFQYNPENDDAIGGLPSEFNICFGSEVGIATDMGYIPAGELEIGDLVQTVDAGYQPIRWIGKRTVHAARLASNPKLRPIRIRAGALGQGQPERDTLVSPQHRVVARGKVVERMFGSLEVLVAAKQLVLLDGIDVVEDVAEVTYVHFLLDDHQIVIAEGAHMESLYTGPETLKALTPEQREEVLSLFPEMADPEMGNLPFSARPLAPGRKARNMAIRLRRKGRELFETL